jgi:regulator of cell morphogenesis and NO signaling
MTTSIEQTLAELVSADPSAARIFEHLGLDYCCHGDRTLADACSTAGLEASHVATELDALPARGDVAWLGLSPGRLADHIVATHHRYLRDELPVVEALAGKVESVHGERHPELAAVHRLVVALRTDLEPHLDKEERVLFPAVHALEQGRRTFPFGDITNPIHMMTTEHDRAGAILAQLRETTRHFEVPADGCASYRALYERLTAIERDTHTHIHKENYTLFPAAIRLAESNVHASAGPRFSTG